MMSKFKQIVIDKSAFVGIDLDEMCDFAKHHLLFAPGVLLYECATDRDRQKWSLERYQKIIRAGACCCPMGRDFTQWEGWHCRPYPSCLAATEDMTERIIRGEVQLDEILTPADARKWESSRTRGARAKYIELSQTLKEEVAQNCPNLREELKVFPPDRLDRLRSILDRMARFDIREMAIKAFPSDWIKAKDEFCLSDEWMTWHRMRLGLAIAYEYSYWNLKHGNTPDETNAEHDDQDAEYVLLLSRADAIITGDKKLVEPLACAAFPEKDVFSSLDEVPESYRCDWANG